MGGESPLEFTDRIPIAICTGLVKEIRKLSLFEQYVSAKV